MASNLHRAAWGACLTIVACGMAPSRTPLGGNYDAPAAATSNARPTPAKPAATSQAGAEPAPESTAHVGAVAPPASAVAEVGTAAKAPPTADVLRYEVLKAGDRVKANISLTVAAEMHGGPPGMLPNSKISMSMEQRVELKIVKASPSSLDELELTLTLLSMRGELMGRTSSEKTGPPAVYDVTLSGRSPSIRTRDGSKVETSDRALLTALIVPIAEFHAHWSRSATLELKPGYAARIPISVASIFENGGDKLKVGPFVANYAGRDAASDQVPFTASLPIKYAADQGQLELDLSGTAKVGMAKGRPSAIELAGPLNAHGGPGGEPISVDGTAKFSATLSYP